MNTSPIKAKKVDFFLYRSETYLVGSITWSLKPRVWRRQVKYDFALCGRRIRGGRTGMKSASRRITWPVIRRKTGERTSGNLSQLLGRFGSRNVKRRTLLMLRAGAAWHAGQRTKYKFWLENYSEAARGRKYCVPLTGSWRRRRRSWRSSLRSTKSMSEVLITRRSEAA